MADGKDLDSTDFTATANNLLHSLFTQCSITLNGTITSTSGLYQYRFISRHFGPMAVTL